MEKNKVQIEKAIDELLDLCNIYKNDDFSFDYDKVLDLVREASKTIEDTIKCKRPVQLPDEVTWSESLYNPEEDLNPFIYKGDMSVEEFRTAQESHLDDEIEI